MTLMLADRVAVIEDADDARKYVMPGAVVLGAVGLGLLIRNAMRD